METLNMSQRERDRLAAPAGVKRGEHHPRTQNPQARARLAGGFAGKIFTFYGRMLRQFQKLILHEQLDLVSGNYYIRRHYIGQAKFSSNIGLDQLGK
jgi:hypothetical protein